MSFSELTGTWWLTARSLTPDLAEPQAAIGKASSLVAKVSRQSITLPVDDNVKSWAATGK